MNTIRKSIASLAIASLCCLACSAQAATYNVSYAFATGDKVQGTVAGTLSGTVLSGITAIDLKFDGIDFGTSLTAMTWDTASSAYVNGLTLSTVAANNNFLVYDPTGTYSFSFSVAPDTGVTQVAATNFNSIDHSAAAEDALQSSWSVTAAAVPEPASIAMLAAGLGLLGMVVRRRNA